MIKSFAFQRMQISMEKVTFSIYEMFFQWIWSSMNTPLTHQYFKINTRFPVTLPFYFYLLLFFFTWVCLRIAFFYLNLIINFSFLKRNRKYLTCLLLPRLVSSPKALMGSPSRSWTFGWATHFSDAIWKKNKKNVFLFVWFIVHHHLWH